MAPPLTVLTTLLTGASVKLGVAQLTKRGYMPQSTYVKAALDALKKDDLDGAIAYYKLALRRRRPSEKTEVTGEIIASNILIRISKLEERISELEAESNPSFLSRQYWQRLWQKLRGRVSAEERDKQEKIAECRGAIAVLNRLLSALKEET